VDGKTLRGARGARNNQSFVHMVSEWAATNRVVLSLASISPFVAFPDLEKVV
jgi:hypothetical protein